MKLLATFAINKFYNNINMDKKITFEQMCDPEFRRKELITEKAGAVFIAFSELNGLLNKTQLAEYYFERTQGWFSQRLNGCLLRNKKQSFTEEEYHKLAESFRDIARRLMAHADEIDAAKMETFDD